MDNESFMKIDEVGNIFWRNKGDRLHRLDGPAIEWIDGSKEWYQNGWIHRLGGPAIERVDGSKEWYQNGVLHRLDGPAIEWETGSKEWWKEGRLHRLDGPALIFISGAKFWYKDGNKFKNKDHFFRKLNKKEKELALFSEDFFNS